jgi:hypothetical protein
MHYNHTQIGHLMIFILLITASLFVGILAQADFEPLLLVFAFFILVLIASFTTLNVMINGKYLKIKFGYGIYRKRFALGEILSAKTVKNHWIYGWGIRYWLWPRMQIFNVSGFDAVEIKMKDGKVYRIGTDDPKKLERVIMQAIR